MPQRLLRPRQGAISDSRRRDLLQQLRQDFACKTLGQLAREREAAAYEIEGLLAEIEALSRVAVHPLSYHESSGDLLKVGDVCRLVGLSRSSIYAAMAAGEFPRCIKVSQRASRWRLDEVRAWIRERASAGH